jgi:hypothetical protein
MSTPPDLPGLLDQFRPHVLPARDTVYTRAQLLVLALWMLVIGGWMLTTSIAPSSEVRIDGLPPLRLVSLMSALFVLVLWGTLIATLWRGPLKPPLLARRKTGFGHITFKVPADYVRLGQPVPRWAIPLWWAAQLLFALICALATYYSLLRPGRPW